MELFQLKGIKSPGKVDVYKHGQVELENISDEFAEELWRAGCPFLGLTEKGIQKFFPERTAINVAPIKIPTVTKKNNKK